MASRECMVKNLMQEREEEFTVLNQLRIFSATWNVNGQSPGPESLSGRVHSSKRSRKLICLLILRTLSGMIQVQ